MVIAATASCSLFQVRTSELRLNEGGLSLISYYPKNSIKKLTNIKHARLRCAC